MPKKFICEATTEELQKIYDDCGTLKKMCLIIGCKSDITLRKLLRSRGIDMNKNAQTAYCKRGNRTDEEFESYLQSEYIGKKRSMANIARELNVSRTIVSRYLDKYNIPKRTKSEQQSGERAPGWNGGRHVAQNGYIEISKPDYHRHHRNNYVYEHIYVAEQCLGMPIKKGFVVHHVDRDKTNNSPDNLIVLTKEEHTRLHSKDMRKKKVVNS